jgi:poly(A) polymerase
MSKLNQTAFKNLPGEALSALIQDYLEDITDWEAGIAENYKNTFASARAFVLPMNPPRFELDHAVRLFFAAHGITIKKSRLADALLPVRKSGHSMENAEARKLAMPGESGDGAPAKRRRRRHHNSATRPPASPEQ